MDVARIEIAKLELSEGDTLVVRTGLALSRQQFEMLQAYASARVPAGVNVLLLDRCITVEALKRAEAEQAPASNPAA